MNIRTFKKSDAGQIAQLFHDTIRQVNRKDYSEQQVKAWAPDDIHFRDWAKACSQKYTFIAEEDRIIAGFAELEEDGHIDCFYCHKNFQQQGAGTLLFRRLEEKAKELRLSRLYAEVSITAKPFFLKMGFSVLMSTTAMIIFAIIFVSLIGAFFGFIGGLIKKYVGKDVSQATSNTSKAG